MPESTLKTARKDIEKEAKRQAILETAVELFSDYGFHEVTVDQIAYEAGLSKGSIYLYFKNKDDLFYSIIVGKSKELIDNLKTAIETTQPFDVCFKKYVYEYLKFFEINEAFFKISQSAKSRMNAEAHFKFHEDVNQIYDQFFQIGRKLIEQGQKEHILRKDNTEAIGKALLGFLNSYIYIRILGFESGTAEDETREIWELFMNGAKNNV